MWNPIYAKGCLPSHGKAVKTKSAQGTVDRGVTHPTAFKPFILGPQIVDTVAFSAVFAEFDLNPVTRQTGEFT